MPLTWDGLSDGDKAAFKGTGEVVTLLAGTRIWKLTSYQPRYARSSTSALSAETAQSPWWSNRDRYKGDPGLREVIDEARLNMTTLITYVRNKSAVKLEWNGLKYYFEIELSGDTEAIWGKIAAQRVTDGVDAYGGAHGGLHGGTYFPDVVGGWDDAYQLYVPGLTATKVRTWEFFDCDDKALRAHLGLG